jgi:hypothetical protein
MTVLATLNTRFPKFTLKQLLAEVQRWIEMGHSMSILRAIFWKEKW